MVGSNLTYKLKLYGVRTFTAYALQEFAATVRGYTLKSYSQFGEDVVIDRLLGHKKNGFYVDVGANDPDRFNNTKRFYLRGWRGINIEPEESIFMKLKLKRPDDTNLQMGVSDKKDFLTFYSFDPDTLSTFSQEQSEEYVKRGYKIVNTEKIKVATLSEIFDNYLDEENIDLLTVDTEGRDMEVLRGNDWHRYKPKVICIETSERLISNGGKFKTDILRFLTARGYKEVYKNSVNSIFILDTL